MFLQHQNVLLHFHFWDLISSFDPELCICIYVAYQPAFGWPPLPIFNLLREKMFFAFDKVKTRVGHSVSDYAVSFMRLCVMDPVLMSADDGTGPRQKCWKYWPFEKNDQRQLERTGCRVCYILWNKISASTSQNVYRTFKVNIKSVYDIHFDQTFKHCQRHYGPKG